MDISQVSQPFGPPIKADVAIPRAKQAPIDTPVRSVVGSGKGSVDPAVLRQAMDKINQTMQSLGNTLEFSVDSETSTNIVKVVDKATNKTIRQFPSEETLAIAKTLDKLQGLLHSVTA